MPATGVTVACRPLFFIVMITFSDSSSLPLRFTFMPGISSPLVTPRSSDTNDSMDVMPAGVRRWRVGDEADLAAPEDVLSQVVDQQRDFRRRFDFDAARVLNLVTDGQRLAGGRDVE